MPSGACGRGLGCDDLSCKICSANRSPNHEIRFIGHPVNVFCHTLAGLRYGLLRDGLLLAKKRLRGCEAAIVAELAQSKKEVLVLAYSFTSVPIYDALVAARTRGVAVTVVVDRLQAAGRYSLDERLATTSITVKRDGAHVIMHDKTMLIDDEVLITGSYNFTKAAETRNAENLLIFKPACPLHARYREDFERHLKHSK